MLTRREWVQGSSLSMAALATGCATSRRDRPVEQVSYPAGSLNQDIMDVIGDLRVTGERLRAEDPDGRYYRLPDAAFTEQLSYGGRTLSAGDYYPATNCSTACFEALVRTLNRVEAREGGVLAKLSYDDLSGRRGYPLRSWMMRSKLFDAEIGAASPKFRSMVGPADGFVLYGIGDIIDFRDAAPGDFVQFHRWTRASTPSGWTRYNQGHAVMFTGFLDAVDGAAGKELRESRRYNSGTNCGFTYFSSNSPTNGLSDRKGFFYNKLPAGVVETDPWDRNIQEPESRDDLYALSIARLYHPRLWRRENTNLRIEAYLRGESIYALEKENRLYVDRTYDPRFPDMAVMTAAEEGERAARDEALGAEFSQEEASFATWYNMEE